MEHHSPKRLDINTYKILNIPTLYSKHPQKIRVCMLYLTSENLLAQCIVLQQFSKAFLWYLNLKPMVNKYGGKYLVIPLRYNYSTQWLQHYRMSVNFHHNEHVYDKWQRIINYRTLFTNILMALYFLRPGFIVMFCFSLIKVWILRGQEFFNSSNEYKNIYFWTTS